MRGRFPSMPTLQNPADSEIRTASAPRHEQRGTKLYVPQSNYNYSNVFSTRQLSRFLGDDLWAPATISRQCHRDTLQALNTLPVAVARWVMFPATLKYPLSWLGHFVPDLCPRSAIWVTAINNSLLYSSLLAGAVRGFFGSSYRLLPTTMSHQAWPQGEKMLLVSLLRGTPDFNILLDPWASLITLNSLFELSGVELLFRVQIIRWREAYKYFKDSWNCLLCHQGRKTGGTLALRSGDWAPTINSSTFQPRAILSSVHSFFVPTETARM